MRLVPLAEMVSEELSMSGVRVVRDVIPSSLNARAMLVTFDPRSPLIVVERSVEDACLVNWLTVHELIHAMSPNANLLSASPVLADGIEHLVRLETSLFCLRLDRFVAALVSGCSSDAEMASRLDVPVDEYKGSVRVLKKVYGPNSRSRRISSDACPAVLLRNWRLD